MVPLLNDDLSGFFIMLIACTVEQQQIVKNNIFWPSQSCTTKCKEQSAAVTNPGPPIYLLYNNEIPGVLTLSVPRHNEYCNHTKHKL